MAMADEKKDLPVPHGGGSYVQDPNTGALTQVEKPTQDHPEGNAARKPDGSLYDAPAFAKASAERPAAAKASAGEKE
jgi:hypothetical protein